MDFPIHKVYVEGKDAELSLPIPKILYKYRSVSQDFHLDILRKKQVYFSKPEEFNDPFDCTIPIRFDRLNETEYDELSIAVLMTITGMNLRDATSAYYSKVKPDPTFGSQAYKDKMTSEQLESLRQRVTVFCLSSRNDSTLMWSHYSNNHKGFCVGFDRDHLFYNTGCTIGRIEYLDDFPEFKPTPKQEDWHHPQVLCKAKDWSYESEFRFASYRAGRLFDIHSLAIKEIIFGARTAKDDIDKVLEIIRSDNSLSHVKIYKAQQVAHSFKLQINTL